MAIQTAITSGVPACPRTPSQSRSDSTRLDCSRVPVSQLAVTRARKQQPLGDFVSGEIQEHCFLLGHRDTQSSGDLL